MLCKVGVSQFSQMEGQGTETATKMTRWTRYTFVSYPQELQWHCKSASISRNKGIQNDVLCLFIVYVNFGACISIPTCSWSQSNSHCKRCNYITAKSGRIHSSSLGGLCLMPLGIKHVLLLTIFTHFSFYGLAMLSPQSFHLAIKLLRRKVAYSAAISEVDQWLRKRNVLGTILPEREC